ncbi:DUF1697 domain-containing protein [Jiangella endophytica]|uniref:DUF1697 domain-containing protein n=1 Tax=Jiangella endophytica TaxID=1623398 RepID=UPI001300AA84|nr:DUF1697 domain-containing protein [Jiangella endophytica]
MRYVVLLRGINVGGRNTVSMADLRVHLAASFANVRTYIQTGNIVLDTEASAKDVAAHIERELPQAFTVDAELIRVLVCDAAAFRTILADAPPRFGDQPDTYRYDVWFYLGTTRRDVEPHVSLNPGVDDVHAGESALYHRRLTAHATRSRLARHLLGTPVYESLTVRNWRTTLAIAGMLDTPDTT